METVLLEIHQTRRFAKRLMFMAKAGKHERIVAERAKQIIADLQINPLHEEAECKRTRHGELRLNDCRKYDLSCGFRLISLKRDRRLIFIYVGSHDDSDFATFPARRVNLDGYTLLHCTARYRLSDHFELTGRVENAGDEKYQDVFGYSTPGRGAFVGLNVRL